MRYLVTGGAGFIGSHLVDKLLHSGNSVIVLDDFSTGRRKNLENQGSNPNLEILEGSILDEGLIESAIQKSDRVFHFAATVGVFNIMNDPISSLKTNIRGTENVLDFCADMDTPVLIASSSEVYGKNTSDSLSEDSDRIIGAPQKIRWSYSDAKAIDESLAISLHQKRGLETRIVRLFNTVGPRQIGRYGMVVPRFIEAALKNEPLEVYGSGMQTRCFGHVSDIVAAIILLDQCQNAVGVPVNIGINDEIAILSLAEKVIKQTNSKSSIKKVDYSVAYPAGFEDMQRRVPNNSLLRKLTGWSPEKKLEHIISDIEKYIRNQN